ncbi:MAG: hypothetical protein HUU14_00865 [Dehalococcoidia bacterium]|nr:MAG: hypothetical protein EDM76_01810 [bacterium]MCK6564282.1 hypothetical protein [Dehalococcoidia bacterium]MCL4230403.1 hypothetical protein [Dehalococcoidia bacterium]NUQ54420.1 hypothetical protein [Dehalococcoidia bacterium]
MPQADAATASEYRAALDAWQKHLTRLHDVFLEGAAIEPAALKGLLNREARAWEAYSTARQRLLGLSGPAQPSHPGENPFR